MKFTAHRNITVSALGHVAVFRKGETRTLAPALHQTALLQGLESDGAVAAEKKPDDTARLDAVKDAMRAIAKANKTNDFDAGGVPKVQAIEAIAKVRPASNDERLALWAEVMKPAGA